MNVFLNALRLHRGHEGFRAEGGDRVLGFSCDCGGQRESVMVPTQMLQQTLPEVRDDLARRRHLRTTGRKAKRRAQRKSDRRARALLGRYLSRDQIRMFDHTGEFLVQGQDGCTYRLRERRIHGIEKLDDDGQVTQRLCIVAKDYEIPVCDTLLAQKVLIENDLEALLKVANVTDVGPTERPYRPFQHVGVRIVEPEVRPPTRFPLTAQGQGAPQLLAHDMAAISESHEAIYDLEWRPGPIRGYYLGSNGQAHPCFGPGRLRIPKLWAMNATEGIVRLILGMPVTRCRDRHAVYQYFAALDLVGVHALCHPETPVEAILGTPMCVFEDERVPRDRTYFLAQAEFLGVIAHWGDGGLGFGIHNPRAIVQMQMEM